MLWSSGKSIAWEKARSLNSQTRPRPSESGSQRGGPDALSITASEAADAGSRVRPGGLDILGGMEERSRIKSLPLKPVLYLTNWVHTHNHTLTHTHTHSHTARHTLTQTFTHSHTCKHTHTQPHTFTHTQPPTDISAHTHSHTAT